MTTAIEDKELDKELVELIFIGKNWLSELDLLEKDMQVLKRGYDRGLSRSAGTNDEEEPDEVLFLFEKVENMLKEVRVEAQAYLAFVATLLEHPTAVYNLGLLENHFRIEVKLKDLLRAFNALKQMAGKVYYHY